MATVTSLGFSIFSRYDGTGIARARRDLNRLNNDLTQNDAALRATSRSFGGIRMAAALLAPALLPIGSAAAGATAGLVALGVTGGSALSVYGVATAAAVKRTMEMAAAGKALTPMQTTFVGNVRRMQFAWNQFIASTSNKTLAVANQAVRGLTAGIAHLPRILNAVHPVAMRVATAFRGWMEGAGLRRFVDIIIKHGVPALESLRRAGIHVLTALGIGFRAALPLIKPLTDSIERGALAFRRWAEGGGFNRFVARARADGPIVTEFFKQLVTLTGRLMQAVSPLGDVTLRLATALMRVVNAIPIGVLQAIIYLFYAWKAALLGVMVVHAVARGVTVLRTAWLLLNTAFLTTPIGWIVLAAAALAAGIYFLATRTQFFQTAWRVTWAVVRTIASATWGWMRTVFGATMAVMRASWSFFGRVVRAVWNASIRAVFLFVRGGANVMRAVFAAATAGMRVAWNFLGRVLRAVWSASIRVVYLFVRGGANVMRAVFNAATAGMRAAWNFFGRVLRAVWSGAIRVVFLFVRGGANVMRNVFRAATAAMRAAWNFLGRVLRAVWSGTIRAVYLFVRGGINTVRNVFRGATAGIRAAWSFMGRVIRAVWTGTIRGAFNAIKAALGTVRRAFGTAVNGIRSAWGRLRAATAAPVRFFINTVYNNGLRRAWNATAGKIPGVPDLPRARSFATGGHVRGPGTSTSDSIPAMLSNGEYVVNAAATKKLGVGTLDMLNKGVVPMNGRTPTPAKNSNSGGMGGLDDLLGKIGGFLGDTIKGIGSKIGAGAKWVTGNFVKGIDWSGGFFESVAQKATDLLFAPAIHLVKSITSKFKGSGIVGEGVKENALRGFEKMIEFVLSKAIPDPGMFINPVPGGRYGTPFGKRGGMWASGRHTGLDITKSAGAKVVASAGGTLSRRSGGPYGNHAIIDHGGGLTSLYAHMSRFAGKVGAVSQGEAIGAIGSTGNSTGPHLHFEIREKGKPVDPMDYLTGKKFGGGKGAGQWRSVVLAVLKELGESPAHLNNVLRAIMKESGGNPRAQNNWDSNARRGTPSGGLLQTIGPTFNAYAGKYKKLGMFHPYANIYAAIRYARARYGSGWSARMARPGGYAMGGLVQSYDQGGMLPTGLSLAYNGTGRPEPVGHDLVGKGEVHVHIHGNVYAKSSREFEDMVITAMSDAKRKGRLPSSK